MTLDVAVVCEFPSVLGGERSLLALIPALRGGGVRFHAVVPGGKLAESFENAGATVVPWSAGRDERGEKLRGFAEQELADILRRLRPDLVHANSLAMGRVVGRILGGLGAPSIAHLRDIVRQSRSAVADINANTRLLAVSRAVKQFHAAAGMSPEKIHVVYNGVDLTEFQPRRPTGWLHRELGLSAEMRLVGAVGQVSLRKGWDVLLDAASNVMARREDAAFVLVGACYSDKPETREVERKLVEAMRRYSGRVFWLGERDDVAAILPELTVLAHAARQEPLGRALLEAAATGRAIVATDVGGTSEIFPPPAAAARLIAPDDSRALADATVSLLDDGSERERLGDAARKRAVAAFDAQNAAGELLRHYREVAAIRG